MSSNNHAESLIPAPMGIQRAISWNVEEYSKIKDYMAKIRFARFLKDYDFAYSLTKMFNSFIKKRANDHRPTKIYHTDVEAIDAILGFNKVTTRGILWIVARLASQSTKDQTYMSLGTSNVPETIGQRKLLKPEARLSVLIDGGVAARGNVLNHIGTFGYGLRTDKYYEFGIHDSALEPSNMFSRSVIARGLQQTQNGTFLTASHSAVFEPR